MLDEEVLRTAVYGCGEFFDWLCQFGTCEQVYHLVNLGDADAHGPIYGPGLLDFPNRIRDNLNCRDDAIGPGWGGTYVKYTMLEAIEKLGLDVEIYTEHAARHLLTDEQRRHHRAWSLTIPAARPRSTPRWSSWPPAASARATRSSGSSRPGSLRGRHPSTASPCPLTPATASTCSGS